MNLTVARMLHKWLAQLNRETVNDQVFRGYQHRVELHLAPPPFGDITLKKLTPAQVREHFQTTLTQKLKTKGKGKGVEPLLSYSSRRNIWVVFHMAMKWALIEGYIDRLPGVLEAKPRQSTPKRIVVYFLKHSSPPENGQKDYQNQPPDFWKAAGSVGRFWGRWGLEVETTSIEISEEHAKFISRVLRRWARANSKPRKVNVWRVNQATGELRKRKVNRRPKRMPRTQGFCSVNDGSKAGASLAKAIRARFGESTISSQ